MKGLIEMYAGVIAYQLAKSTGGKNPRGPQVKHGDEILEGPYPKSFMEFIGQPTARMQILASITSAAKRNMPVSHTLLASGTPGVGKGHPLDTLILTPQGWRRIGDLKVGDSITGSDGKATTVTGVFDRGVLHVFRVEFSDGSSTLCDGDHLWRVQDNHRRFRTLSTQEIADQDPLTPDGKARYRIPMVTPVGAHGQVDVDLPVVNLPIEPYLLGVLLANAHLSHGVLVRTNDVEIIDRVRRRNPQLLIKESTSVNSTARGWSVSGLRPALKSLGLYETRSATKFIPSIYLTADVESRRELLRGLMDCDGSPRTGKGNPQYFTQSSRLATAVQYLAESLGGTGHIMVAGRVDNRGDASEHRVSIALAEPVFTLPRKAALERQGRPVRTIRSITLVRDSWSHLPRKSEIRCIKVEATDSLYVTERFVVTHNTALARLTAHQIGKGFIELGGNVSDKDAVKALKVMQDGDILFIDEIHRLVASGKSRAEWLLTLLQDGELHMPTGVITAPLITIIAATTDREKLPQTILDRFPIQPVLLPYTIEEAIQIGALSARRLGFGELIPMPERTDWLTGVALASENNPRRMGNLLMSVRDIALATDLSNLHDDQYTLDEALTWNGLTADGLTRVAQDFLLALFALGGTAGISSVKAMVGEEQVTQTERSLIQRGFVTITPRGRELTEFGEDRTRELAIDRTKVA
jgi:Holliday junction resolvasome RuvABC ATP-dependent DNA helicase subunit